MIMLFYTIEFNLFIVFILYVIYKIPKYLHIEGNFTIVNFKLLFFKNLIKNFIQYLTNNFQIQKNIPKNSG